MRPHLLTTLVCLIVFSTGLFAATPLLLSYQGRLTDDAGLALNGSHQLAFALYDSDSGGAMVWSELHPAVTVTDGLFSVVLGSINPLAPGYFVGPNRYLAISVDGGPELAPRQQMLSSAYAFHSFDSDLLEGESASHYHSWTNLTNMPAGFADGTDNVGTGDITEVVAGDGLEGGATTGSATLGIADAGVTSTHLLDGTITNVDINAAAGIAVGKISGTAMNLTSSQIVSASKTFEGGLHIGDSTLYGNNSGIVIGSDAFSPSSTYLLQIIRNYSTTGSRYGIYADLDNFSTGTVYGIRSRASGATAGAANAGTAYGFYGVGISDGGSRYGAYVHGRARTVGLATGSSYGLYAEASYGVGAYGAELHTTDAISGFGVFAEVSGNSTGTGVYTSVHDNSASASSIGTTNYVLNNGGNAYGISGTTGSNVGTGYAVYGHSYSNATNWSGYFTGDVYVGGNVYMPAKITRIDHPTDPENQSLQLAGIDSPEMLVTISGNAETDAAGQAEVAVPTYFTAITSDHRYQLTVIGQFAQAIVSAELAGDRFQIKTDQPNVKVSWAVTGVRTDKFATANPLIPELAKPAEQRGRYLHPQPYGLPFELSIDYPSVQELMKQPPRSQRPATEADDADE